MPRLNAANNASTVLVQACSSSDTTIYVQDVSRFPVPPFRITVDNEIMEVVAVAANLKTFAVSRAQEGTVATSHGIGASVENRWTAGTFAELADKAQDVDPKFDASTGHKHSGAAGDAPPVPWANVSGKPALVENAGNTPSILADTEANRPAAGVVGRIFIATDTQRIYRDTGTAWVLVGVVQWADVANKPSTFPPSAHKSTHASGGADALTPADIDAVNRRGDTFINSSGVAQIWIQPDSPAGYVVTMRNSKGDANDVLRVRNAADTVTVFAVRGDGTVLINNNPVWHAGNDGAGSGLDADAVDGLHVTGSSTPGLRKITISSADPSGGSDGDVWFKYLP